jgi:predicted Fe-Mo cluster-binding NifX family protein
MGRGAYIHLEEAGIRPIITDIEDIRTAISAYLSGEIEDHTERLH